MSRHLPSSHFSWLSFLTFCSGLVSLCFGLEELVGLKLFSSDMSVFTSISFPFTLSRLPNAFIPSLVLTFLRFVTYFSKLRTFLVTACKTFFPVASPFQSFPIVSCFLLAPDVCRHNDFYIYTGPKQISCKVLGVFSYSCLCFCMWKGVHILH